MRTRERLRARLGLRLRAKLGLGLGVVVGLVGCDRPEAPDCVQRAGEWGKDSVVWEGVEVDRLLLYDRIDVRWVEGEVGRTVVVWEGPVNLLADAVTDWDGQVLELGDGNTCRWVRDLGITLRATVVSPRLVAVEHRGAGAFEAALDEETGSFRLDARNCSGRVDVEAFCDTVGVLLHSGAVTGRVTGAPRVLEGFAAGLAGLDASECYAERAFVHTGALRPLRFRASTYAYVAISGPGDAVLHGPDPGQLQVERTGEGGLVRE